MRRFAAALAVAVAFVGSALAAPQNFALHKEPREVADLAFADAEGREVTLSDFRGGTILVNIWATWCPPCVKEMPTLDALQAELGGESFEVVALSIDRAGPEAVRAFYERIAVENLALYIDESSRASATLGAFGLPATLLIDPEGRELGRLIGPAEWDAAAMVEFLRGVIADRAAAASQAQSQRRSGLKRSKPRSLRQAGDARSSGVPTGRSGHKGTL